VCRNKTTTNKAAEQERPEKAAAQKAFFYRLINLKTYTKLHYSPTPTTKKALGVGWKCRSWGTRTDCKRERHLIPNETRISGAVLYADIETITTIERPLNLAERLY